MALTDLEAEVVALRKENEALRAELVDARKTIKLLKLLDAGALSSELTASMNSRRITLEAELKEEREAKERERTEQKARQRASLQQSLEPSAALGVPEERARHEKSPRRMQPSPARHRGDEESSSVFSFLTADPIERFGHVFRFKKDTPSAALAEIQISAPADFRAGEGVSAIAKISSSGSESSPRRDSAKKDPSIFGLPIDLLMKNGASPAFLVQAFAALEPALDKNLFVPGSTAAALSAHRSRFTLTGTVDLSGLSNEVIASLVLAFLEEMPDTIVSPSQVMRLLQCIRVKDKRYKTLSQRMVLGSMSANGRALLELTMKFIRKSVSQKGMSTADAAKFFVPFLCKQRVMSPRMDDVKHTSGDVKHTPDDASKVLADLLESPDDLFALESDVDRKWCLSDNCLQVKNASPARIVEIFSFFCYGEPHFIDVYALTRPYFMSALEGLSAFCVQYEAYNGDEPWQRDARLHVLSNLRAWAEQQRVMLLEERGFVYALNAFVQQHAPTAREEEKLHWEALSSCFEKHSLLRSTVTMASFGKFAQVRRSTLRDKVPEINILELDSAAAAGQMTLLDHSLFAQIPMDEFLFKNFTKPEKCPSFTEFAGKFEQWGLWVASQIVARKSLNERADVIEKMISIAHHCVKLNNYNTAAAMLYGLFNRSITRLKSTWLKVDKKRLAEMKKIEALFATSRNYKTYREVLAGALPPLVPHIALVPKDLFAIEETNATLVDNLVNMDKMRLLYGLLSRLRRWQTISYKNLQPDEHMLGYFKQLRYMPDDTIYEHSREAEPSRK